MTSASSILITDQYKKEKPIQTKLKTQAIILTENITYYSNMPLISCHLALYKMIKWQLQSPLRKVSIPEQGLKVLSSGILEWSVKVLQSGYFKNTKISFSFEK